MGGSPSGSLSDGCGGVLRGGLGSLGDGGVDVSGVGVGRITVKLNRI